MPLLALYQRPRRVYSRPLARGPALAPSEFFSGLRKGVKAALPQPLRGFDLTRGHSRLLKIHYGHPETHFEAWHHTGEGRLEVGLHFEGSADLNQRAFDYFRARIVEVKAQLPRAELEPWDRGWTRLYETLSAAQLDEPARDAGIERLSRYIAVLQPMLESFWGE
jgi:hypothetical protein